jgi:hypothetical protein
MTHTDINPFLVARVKYSVVEGKYVKKLYIKGPHLKFSNLQELIVKLSKRPQITPRGG